MSSAAAMTDPTTIAAISLSFRELEEELDAGRGAVVGSVVVVVAGTVVVVVTMVVEDRHWLISVTSKVWLNCVNVEHVPLSPKTA